VNNGEWVHLQKEGREYAAVIHPRPGKLTVNARFGNGEPHYNTLLKYRVN
jgi:hypothetical protein